MRTVSLKSRPDISSNACGGIMLFRSFMYTVVLVALNYGFDLTSVDNDNDDPSGVTGLIPKVHRNICC